MSAIFISHSSNDNAFAARLKEFLTTIGHQSFFLDIDPEKGIPAGCNWEKELYNSLRKCRIVILLYSTDFIASRWCFAELTHARALGKYIIPLRIDKCSIEGVLSDTQFIDVTQDVEAAFKNLENSLSAAGISNEDWDTTRSPYPGLLTFQEQDAPVFFGREEEIQGLLKSVRQFRNFGGAKLLLVLGASGSGKSSLIRAGLIPWLRKDKRSWIIIGPFRPLKTPFEELSKSIANAFNSFTITKNWSDIYASLIADARNKGSGEVLQHLVSDLISLSEQKSATILIFIDQLEELLQDDNTVNETDDTEDQLFLSYLCNFLSSPAYNILLIVTLRSDFLGKFQLNPNLKGLHFDDYILTSVSPQGLRASITGPAQMAGIELKEGLTEKLLSDTGASDALPLLAFTLRELWEQYGQNGVVYLEDYQKMGDINAAVGRTAETVLINHIVNTGRSQKMRSTGLENKAIMPEEDERQLKMAFMALVRIDEEGRFTKKMAQPGDFSPTVMDLIEKFIAARLLVANGDGHTVKIEVVHEALFRTWERLVKWLEESKGFLVWQKRLHTALEEWEIGSGNELQLLRGPALSEATGWLEKYNSGGYNLTRKEIDFINASRANHQNEQKKIEDQRKRKLRNTRILLGLAAIVVVIISVLLFNINKSNTENRNQLGRSYWDKSTEAETKGDGLRSLLFTAEAVAITKDADLKKSLLMDARDNLSFIRLNNILSEQSKFISRVFSPDGKLLLTAGEDQSVRLWDIATGKQVSEMKHDSLVNMSNFSPDGKRIVTVSTDQTTRIWDAATGKQIMPAMKHSDTTSSAVFSPDSKNILTIGRDGTARLWDIETGKQIGRSMKHGGLILHTVFSPDSKQLLTTIEYRNPYLWDATTGNPMALDMKQTDTVNSAVFSPDGKLILTASQDQTARFWDVATGKQTGPIIKHENIVWIAVFSPDAKRVLTICENQPARLWDAVTGKQIGPAMKHDGMVNNAAFSPDGKQIITTGLDQTLRLWNVATGKQIGPPVEYENYIFKVVFSLNSRQFLTAGTDQTILWDIVPQTPTGPAMKHDSAINSAVFHPDGKQVLTASNDGTARVWDVTTGRQMGPPIKHEKIVTYATFSPDGKQILTLSKETAGLWDFATRKPMGPAMKHSDEINCVNFSPDGRHVLTGSRDGTVRLWNGTTGKQIGPDMKHEHMVSSVVFSHDGKRVLTTSQDLTARIWEVATGQQIGPTMKHEGGGIANGVFSHDDKRVLTSSGDGTARLWDAATGKQDEPAMKHEDIVNSAFFSPDAKRIVTASRDKTARLWDITTLKQAALVMRHENTVYNAVFSADGNWILTANRDQTARLWDVATGKQIRPTMRHENRNNSATFSPDGKYVITIDSNNTARIWSLETDLDIPSDLFKLQVQAITGAKLNTGTDEAEVIAAKEWQELNIKYLKEAKEHFKRCKYRKHNVWAKFYPEEAKKISLK